MHLAWLYCEPQRVCTQGIGRWCVRIRLGGRVTEPPPIKFARTKDGVRIAYYAVGEGRALIVMGTLPYRHVLRQWDLYPEDQLLAQLLPRQGRRFVQFDPRGMGSSSSVSKFSLDDFVADLEAVVDTLGIDEFDLAAAIYSTPIAIAYAARHAERVSHLILLTAFARGSDAMATPAGEALRALRGQDWDIYADTAMHIVYGWEQRSEARSRTAVLREAITPEQASKVFEAIDRFDVTQLLPNVKAPTLVLAEADSFVPIEESRAVAADIPEARFAVLQRGDNGFGLMAEFLGLAGPPPMSSAHSVLQASTSTAIIMFADIADSTAMTERIGDAAFRQRARALDEALRRAIKSSDGSAIDGKLLGDGVLAVFSAAREAIACAASCHLAAEDVDLKLHVGVHAGDVIREERNVYGGAVNIAARVAAETAPGETLVSGTVRELARTSSDVTFEDRGERELKGVSERVRVFRVIGAASSQMA
jgi:class 3 adenylate cyclase/pimeloyl-ACP methyl ester carboxylesterase